MNPLQTDVLRAAARLSLGFVLENAAGEPAFAIPSMNRVPRLFLWIEFWKPRTFLVAATAPSAAVGGLQW